MVVEELQEIGVEKLQFALQNANKEIYSIEEISKFKLNEDYLKSNKTCFFLFKRVYYCYPA